MGIRHRVFIGLRVTLDVTAQRRIHHTRSWRIPATWKFPLIYTWILVKRSSGRLICQGKGNIQTRHSLTPPTWNNGSARADCPTLSSKGCPWCDVELDSMDSKVVAVSTSVSRLGTVSVVSGDVSEVVERGGSFTVDFLGTVWAPWLACRQRRLEKRRTAGAKYSSS